MLTRWQSSIVLANALLLAAVVAAMTPVSAAADVIAWAPDLETAQATASREGRLVLIHFWSDDCPPCRALEANVFTRPDVAQAIAARYVPVKVHAKRRSDLSRRFEVDRWPTDVVITPSGQKIASMVSPQDPQQYINTFTQIASRMLPPTPDTQTASLAAEQPYAPYSNTYSDRDPISGAPRPQTDPLQDSPYGSAANAAQAQYNSRYNGGNAVPAGPYSHNPPTSESAYQAAANNAYQASAAVNSASAYRPSAEGSIYGNNAGAPQDNGSAYGSRYGSAYGAAPANPSASASFDYNPAPAQAAAPSPYQPNAYQPGPGMAAAPQPQGAAYQPRYSNEAAPHSTISEPVSQAMNNPYANAAPSDAGNERRQVFEWDNQQPTQSSAPAQPQAAAPHQPPPQQGPAPQPPQMAQVPQQAPAPPANAPIALDGHCPIALNGSEPAWVPGDPRFGAIHRGRTYLFSSAAAQQQFLSDPDRYAPALSGYDPVRFVEEKQIVPGSRAFGWFYQDRYYLFADEAGLRRFEKSPELYHEVVQQAMRGGPGQQQSPQGTMYR